MTEETTAIATLADTPLAATPASQLQRIEMSFEAIEKLANKIAVANWAPRHYRKDIPRVNGKPDPNIKIEDQPFDENKLFIGIYQGCEIGLRPMQAIQSIAVINGMPSIYGDAMLGLVRASGLLAEFKEEEIVGTYEADGENRGDRVKIENFVIGYRCISRRKGYSDKVVTTFTIDDAKRAGLWGKEGPWKTSHQRMLQFRARSWNLRDGYGDVLKGLYSAEEAQDVVDIGVVASAPASAQQKPMGALTHAKTAGAKLDAFAGSPAKPDAAQDATFEEMDASQRSPEPGPEPDGEDTAMATFPAVPDEVEASLREGKATPFVKWFSMVVHSLADERRQDFADLHMVTLGNLAGLSARNKDVLNNLASGAGFNLTGEVS